MAATNNNVNSTVKPAHKKVWCLADFLLTFFKVITIMMQLIIKNKCKLMTAFLKKEWETF